MDGMDDIGSLNWHPFQSDFNEQWKRDLLRDISCFIPLVEQKHVQEWASANSQLLDTFAAFLGMQFEMDKHEILDVCPCHPEQALILKLSDPDDFTEKFTIAWPVTDGWHIGDELSEGIESALEHAFLGCWINRSYGKVKQASEPLRQPVDIMAHQAVITMERFRSTFPDMPLDFHGSLVDTASPPVPFQHFKPLTHVGTLRGAVEAAMRRGLTNGRAIRLYATSISFQNPCRIRDRGMNHDAWEYFHALDTVLKHDMALREDLKEKLQGKDVTEEARCRMISEALQRLGHDGIVYINRGEDPGNESKIILNPTQLSIIAVTNPDGTISIADPKIRALWEHRTANCL